jgi:hypothetical protein
MQRFFKLVIKTLLDYRVSIYCYKKISGFYGRHKIPDDLFDKKVMKVHLNRWRRIKKHYLSTKWFKIYQFVSNIESADYVPENIFYTMIQPCLNNQMFNLGYSEKNFYDKFYQSEAFPNTIIRNINGTWYNKEYEIIHNIEELFDQYILNHKRIITKPTVDSSSGSNIQLFIKKKDGFYNSEGNCLSLDFVYKVYNKDFILQDYITQHDYFSAFNKTSLNTVRMLTYRSVKSEEVTILGTVLRMGRKGKIVDNYTIGGIALGINNDGTANSFAVDKYGNKYEQNLNKTLFFNELKPVHRFEEIKQFAIEIAKKNPYHRMLALDLSIDIDENIRILEVNNSNLEINFFQYQQGPLFKEKTDEVIDYCLKNKRSICLDFYTK